MKNIVKWEKKIYKWDRIIVDIDISEIKIWIDEVLVKIFDKLEIENKIKEERQWTQDIVKYFILKRLLIWRILWKFLEKWW